MPFAGTIGGLYYQHVENSGGISLRTSASPR